MDLLGDIPIFTRCWGTGIILLNFALWCDFLTVYDVVYSWDAVYNRKQYLRLIYGVFYIKLSPELLMNAFVSLSSLQQIEQSTADKRKLALKILFLYVSIVVCIGYTDLPVLSIGEVMGMNMWYYSSKKSNNPAILLVNAAVDQIWIPLSLVSFMYLTGILKLAQAFSLVLPGHMLYFIDEAMSKTYGINM
ncbi:unnamed protein product [Kluyveromyces dobzhanskii CBS 2104]|uniref:Derlin n=1 Tax=Kluyveromyces dobzhanskii CBS 2104 TaxID=1427455 RepID=A0A0A8LAE0_9SACH|nr:unnamed protein product [Kluyveromyces dobzhanskii CBS 2104]